MIRTSGRVAAGAQREALAFGEGDVQFEAGAVELAAECGVLGFEGGAAGFEAARRAAWRWRCSRW